jgi:hypothetical protein
MTKKVEINKSETHNYHVYDGQCQAQPAFVEFNCQTGELSSDWDGEIGNGVPVDVWNKLRLRWSIPSALDVYSINDLMETIEGYCQDVSDGFENVWDGSNWVGKYTEKAQDAKEAIEHLIENAQYHCEYMIIVDNWDNWLGFDFNASYLKKHESVEEMEKSLREDMDSEGCVVEITEDLSDWIEEAVVSELENNEEAFEDIFKNLPQWAQELYDVKEAHKEWLKEKDENAIVLYLDVTGTPDEPGWIITDKEGIDTLACFEPGEYDEAVKRAEEMANDRGVDLIVENTPKDLSDEIRDSIIENEASKRIERKRGEALKAAHDKMKEEDSLVKKLRDLSAATDRLGMHDASDELTGIINEFEDKTKGCFYYHRDSKVEGEK